MDHAGHVRARLVFRVNVGVLLHGPLQNKLDKVCRFVCTGRFRSLASPVETGK